MHNLTEENLRSALRLGGLPMPSIAVVKATEGHSKYGPISLVFDRHSIDPEADSRNKVYGGDAYTPTAPIVEYPVNYGRLSEIERDIHRLSKDVSVGGGIFGNSSALRSMGIDETSAKSTEELARELSHTDTVQAAYLTDNGKTLEPVKKDKVWDKYGNATLQKVIDRIGVQELAGIEANLELGESIEQALGDHAGIIRDILREYYRKHGEPMLIKMAAKHKWDAQEIQENREDRINRSMENNVTNFALENIIRHAWEMYQDGGATKGEIDRLATSDALRDMVSDKEVEQWIADKLDGLLGDAGIYNGEDRLTPSGKRRSFTSLHYPYTLENIVKTMRENQPERGGQTWGISAGALQASASRAYRTVSEIKEDIGRLGKVEGDAYDAQVAEVDEKIRDAIQRVRKGNKPHADNTFEEEEIVGSILMDAAQGKKNCRCNRAGILQRGLQNQLPDSAEYSGPLQSRRCAAHGILRGQASAGGALRGSSGRHCPRQYR